MNKGVAETDAEMKKLQKQLDWEKEKARRAQQAMDRKLEAQIERVPSAPQFQEQLQRLEVENAERLRQSRERLELERLERQRAESYQQQKWKAEAEQRANQQKLRKN